MCVCVCVCVLEVTNDVIACFLKILVTSFSKTKKKMSAMATGTPITPLKLIKCNEKIQTVSHNVCML